MAIAVVVGNVIGSGIFLKPGNIAAESGSFAVILGVWVIGGVLCILGAMCFAELATMLPEAGGIYVYLREAYGRFVAFLFGWTEFLLLRPASIAALAVAFVGSLSLAMNWQVSSAAQLVMCTTLILIMAGVNVAGVIWGGRIQLLTTIVKAGLLAAVAMAPILVAPFVGWTVDVENYATAVKTATPLSAQVAAILLAVMWAYDGWHGITPLAEEVRDPQRNIPLALFGGLGILIGLYVAANLAYHGVLSNEEMRAAGDHAAERMLHRLAGPVGRSAMSMVIMCSTFGAINSNLLMAPRITFAMGRDRLFFASLGRVHGSFGTPVIAILTTAIMALGLLAAVAISKIAVAGVSATSVDGALTSRVVQSLHDDSTFDLMTNFFTFSASIFYAMAVGAVIVLRLRRPEAERPYRVVGYPLVPILFLSVYMWFLSQAYVNNPVESRAGMVFIVSGIPVFFIYRAWTRRESA